MARIAGVDLPREKRIEIGLTYIYGIGRARSNSILYRAGVDPNSRVSRAVRSPMRSSLPVQWIQLHVRTDVPRPQR